MREQVIRYIRFALDELGSTNGHHRFEDLCRHFARERIAPNILPATGPVGAGGDRGRDFETFRTFLREELGPYGGFAGFVRDGDAIAFACTLQRDRLQTKLLSDVEKIVAAGTRVTAIYAFLTAALPKSRRDKVQDEVRNRYGVHLEVLDGLALAEALADPKIFWIAEQFLSIPEAVRPRPPSAGPQLPDWYTADRNRWRARGEVNPRMGELLDVVDGLRYATFHPEARSDLPFWLELVRGLDREEVPLDVRQRARFEIAASQLRGMGDLRPADETARVYVRETIRQEDDPSRLQDAAVLLSYAGTAVAVGHSNLHASELSAIGSQLRERIRTLLADQPPRTRRARLLEVLGQLAVIPDPAALSSPVEGAPASENAAVQIDRARAEGVPDEVVASLPCADIDEAMQAWGELAAMLETTPLYPVESWAEMLDFLAPRLLRQPGWQAIEHNVDEALQRARGGDAAAERSRDRALRLLEQDRLRDGLAELHRAADRWWSGDSLRAALLCMLMIADVYKRLRMPQAARHYALAVAGAAQVSSDDDVADLVPHAILVASEIEYATGAWASALEHVEIGLTAQAALVDEEVDPWAEHDFRNAVLTVGMALRAAQALLPEFVPTVERLARRFGILDHLTEGLADAPAWDRREWAQLADDQLLGRPFGDLGPERFFTFAALGTRWTVRGTSEYRCARTAERLAAAGQILVVELADEDLCLLPVHIDIEVRLRDDPEPETGARVQRRTDGPAWAWLVELEPFVPGEPMDEEAHFSETLSILVEILTDVSLLPGRTCLDTVLAAFERGLGHKLARGRPFEEMAAIVPPSRYKQTPRDHLPPLADGAPDPVEHPDLGFQDGPGPTYSSEKATMAMRRRYQRLPELFSQSLQRLRTAEEFGAVVAELRSRGWKDWHLLTAIGNVVVNDRLARAGLNTVGALRSPQARARANELGQAAESSEDPILAPERFTTEVLEKARLGAVPAYIAGWDLELQGVVPDMRPVEQLLDARYGYWRDDVSHEDPFPPTRGSRGPATGPTSS